MSKKKSDALDPLLDSIRKNHGDDSIMRLGDKPREPVAVIPTGCLSIDIATGVGGLPRGRIVEILGPESAGKSTLALHAIAATQRLDGVAAYIDAEHAFDTKYAAAVGVDVEELLFSQPDNGEQALNVVEGLVTSGKVMMVVVDSVAALTPKAEIEGDMGAFHVGVHARLMSQALRKLCAVANKNACTIVLINQLRMKIGVLYGNPETTTGGNALKFYASMRLDVRKKEQTKDQEGDPHGNHTKVKVIKNKVAPPFQEAEFEVLWGRGIDLASDVLELAVANGLVEKSGSWFSHGEKRIGQGFNTAASYVRENRELYEALALALREGSLMDPNAILARVLELAAISGRRRLLDDEADELAAGAKSLDEWLTSGGFWPERWAGRGVNLKLANDRGRLDEQFNRVRGLLGTKQIILPSLTPQIVTAVPFEPDDDGRVVAALATHVAFAADPATAVSRLYDMLALTLSKIGEA